MIRFIIQRPVAVMSIAVALILLGCVSILKIPVSPFPHVSIPELSVIVRSEGLQAKELDLTVINSLRNQFRQLANLEEIQSETRDGYSLINLRYSFNVNMNYILMELNDKIDLAMTGFPKGVERPRLIAANATDIPVFKINVTENGVNSFRDPHFRDLSEFVEDVLKRRIEQTPEVAFADISGTVSPEIVISPDRRVLAELGITSQDFYNVINKHDVFGGSVTVDEGAYQYNIRFPLRSLENANDIGNLILRSGERTFKLKEVASINVRQQHPKGIFLSNHQDAITLSIIKQPDIKLSALRDVVSNILREIKAKYPHINFTESQDQTALLEYSINNLQQDLILGSVLAFILMFFFLRNIRSPLLIGISVPTCLLISVLLFNTFHLSINIISLSGLVLGVGLMIDNSIVIIENITQQQKISGLSLEDACVSGVSGVIKPLLASGLVTCSVFLPLILISGVAGALFYDEAMAIAIGLGVSLVISAALLPSLFVIVHRRKKGRIELMLEERFKKNIITGLYEKGFDWVFNHKKKVLLGVFVILILNIVLFRELKKDRLPDFKSTELNVDIDWNSNISVEENRARTELLISKIEKYIDSYTAMIGPQLFLRSKEKQLSNSECLVYLKIKDPSLPGRIKAELSAVLKRSFPESNARISSPPNIFEQIFGDNKSTLSLRVYASVGGVPGGRILHQIKKELSDKFPDARISLTQKEKGVVIRSNAEKLAFYGLSNIELYSKIKAIFSNEPLGVVNNGSNYMPVVLSTPVNTLENILNTEKISNSEGTKIPLNQLVNIGYESNDKVVSGDGNGTFDALDIETENPQPVCDYIYQHLKPTTRNEIRLTGSYFTTRDTISQMIDVLFVSVVLLYFILAAQFESLIQPLIVLIELPIGLFGAFLSLWIFNVSINLISMIGIVMMCGLIINDSILKIDTINNLRRRKGHPLVKAIHYAGQNRLNSILMTATTTILSVVPFLFNNDIGSTLQKPLSIVLLGGMIIGTPVSLYFIPLVYWFCYRKTADKNIRIKHTASTFAN